MAIGELGRAAGVAPSTIRYYESIGLMPEPDRLAGKRRYGPEAVQRLALIDSAKRAGFTLDEVRELLDANRLGDDLRPLARRKLAQTRELIEAARRRERWLEAATRCDCADFDACGLFDSDDLSRADPR